MRSKGQKSGGSNIRGHLNRAEAKERQLVMMVIDLAMSQETLEENHDYCHSTDCSNARVGCFLPLISAPK